GRATVDVDGDAYRGDVALRLGNSRIDAKGSIAATLQVDASLAPLQLGDLLPDGAGTLRGTLALRGARAAPDVQVDLEGSGIAFGDYRAERLAAKGQLPWKHGPSSGSGQAGALDIVASGLQAGVALDRLEARLRGAVQALQFDAEAAGAPGRLALRGDAAGEGARWRGTLASLQLTPATGASWTLQQPARWAWNDGNGSLSRACLHASDGGPSTGSGQAELCASADWPRRGLDLEGSRLPLALAAPYLPERENGRRWALNGELDLVARLRPAGNSWRGTASVSSAAGGLRSTARSRRDLVGYRDLVLDAGFDPQRLQATLGAGLDDDGRVDARI